MNIYKNKDGYKIRATEKAYNLFYKKQGFVPDSEPQEDGHKPYANDSGEVNKMVTEDKSVEPDTDEVTNSSEPKTAELDAAESGEKSIKYWKVEDLKEALNEAGISYKANATKQELYDLLQKAGE